MEKNSAAKLSAFSFLSKTRFFLTDNSPTLLPQMPKEQILYFLKQAYIKSKSITIQTTDRNDLSICHEYTGKLIVSPEDHAKIILSTLDKKTMSIINPNEIRYVRLAHNTAR